MRILQIIDSMELNGGSTMFLELVAGMAKYWPEHEVVPYVVSKTGEYGRSKLVNHDLPSSYGFPDLQTYNYETFAPIVEEQRDVVVFHHVLGHTRPIRFHKSCKYYVVNHSLTNLKRLPKFKADRYISVCRFFSHKTRRVAKLVPQTILNGCEDYYNTEPTIVDKRTIVGRCQRVVPSKFVKEKLPSSFVQYIVGPVNHGKAKSMKGSGNDVFLGPVFDKQQKLGIVKSFDIYLHNARSPEGASVAILEALSCGVPVLARDVGGGVGELVIHERNGMLFRSGSRLNQILRELTPDRLAELAQQTREDFLKRLHIKVALEQYKNLLRIRR